MADKKSQQKLTQKSLLDLFPRKEKPLPVTAVPNPPETAVTAPPDSRLSPEIQIIDHVSNATGLRIEDPIVVVDSPVKSSRQPPKALYSIFAPRTRREPSVTPTSPTKSNLSNREVPYPDRSSQHVRGPQTHFTASPTSLPLRKHPCSSVSSTLLSNVIPISQEVFRPVLTEASRVDAYPIRAAHLATIPTEHLQSHPAIAHVVEIATTESEHNSLGHSHKLWTDKWHPIQADHVLGNESQSIFLRQWLLALEVQYNQTTSSDPVPSQSSGKTRQGRGIKRRNVIRAVDKRPGRKRQRIDSDDDDDSWIVYSDDFFDEAPPSEGFDDIDDLLDSPLPRLGDRTFLDRLTNTILLTGPHSSGKTAAVHACAEELGWEVFEVYPGIGKRSGSNLDNLIGEVGKNHLVRNSQIRNGDSSRADGLLKSAFAHGKDKKSRKNRQLSATVTMDESQAETNELAPRQSLILLEEVDVLFKDDTNFWGALINLIRDCKRPVILTCNDMSLVPVADLPLQDVLNFGLCSIPVATSFLQALCCAEGYLLDRDSLSRFYERPSSFGTDTLVPDLRQAMLNLQLWCPGNLQELQITEGYEDIEDVIYWEWPETHANSIRRATDLKGTCYHTELMSFADCYLFRQTVDMPKEMDCDEVVGYRTLNTNASSFEHGQFGFNDRDEVIVSTAIEISRGVHDLARSSDKSVLTTRENCQARVQYDRAVKEFGNNVHVVAGRSQIIRRPVFDLDYLPWIRQMVATEDKEEAMLRREGDERRRTTRNSMRFARTIELSENARLRLDETTLRG